MGDDRLFLRVLIASFCRSQRTLLVMVFLARGIREALEEAVQAFPVVVLEGGRAVGKSTLCRLVATSAGWPTMIDVSDPAVADAIRLDPLRYLSDLPGPVIIDEAQLLPEISLWVKRVVDERSGSPSQFLLTGSARLAGQGLGGSDPLAGRSVRLRMLSMTPSEQADRPVPVAASLFDAALATDVIGQDSDEWDVRSSRHGGLPGLPGVLREADHGTWEQAVSSYVDSTIPMGASSSRVDHSRLLRAFRYLAANPAQILNVTRMATELAIQPQTARAYLEALEASFLLFRVEAHRPQEHKVLTAHPRVFCADVGLAAWASRVAGLDPRIDGLLLENQVAHSLVASTWWGHDRIALRHWRDQRALQEVDLLCVHPDGRTVPIEVKLATSVGPGDTKGLLAYARANPDSFVRGWVAYCGTRGVDLTPSGMPPRSIVGIPVSRMLLGR
jgi:uncharacterized protein